MIVIDSDSDDTENPLDNKHEHCAADACELSRDGADGMTPSTKGVSTTELLENNDTEVEMNNLSPNLDTNESKKTRTLSESGKFGDEKRWEL